MADPGSAPKNWFGVSTFSLYGVRQGLDWGATTLGHDYSNFSVNSNPLLRGGPARKTVRYPERDRGPKPMVVGRYRAGVR